MAKYLDYSGLLTVWDRIKSYVKARILDLDSSVSATAASGNKYSVLTGITEVDGKLTDKTEVQLEAVAKTGAASDVAITDTGGYFTGENVEAVLQEVGVALGDGGSVASQITAAINALDKTDTAVDTKYVSQVTETDGVITVSRADISDAKINTDYATDKTSVSGNVASGDTINLAFGKIEKQIANKNVSASGETGTSALVTASASNNAVTVGSTSKLLNAVGYAESALQSVSSANTTYLTVGDKSGNTGAKTLALTVQVATVSKTGTVSGNNLDLTGSSGVVPGSSIATIKGYVDDKITASLGNLLKYIVVNSVGDLPSTQVPAGNIYLVPTYKAVSDPVSTANPKTLGWYELSGSTYVLTTDTSVLSGKTYYLKAYDEYILIDGDTQGTYKWEKLGSAGLDLGDYLEKSAVITTSDINNITGITTDFSS